MQGELLWPENTENPKLSHVIQPKNDEQGYRYII